MLKFYTGFEINDVTGTVYNNNINDTAVKNGCGYSSWGSTMMIKIIKYHCLS